jgi:COMPASS component SWD3
VGDGEDEGSMVVYSAGLDKSVKVWRIRVVGKEEDAQEDADEGHAAEVMMPTAAARKVIRDNADVLEEEDGDDLPIGPTPTLSPVWVEKRRHTSRG